MAEYRYVLRTSHRFALPAWLSQSFRRYGLSAGPINCTPKCCNETWPALPMPKRRSSSCEVS